MLSDTKYAIQWIITIWLLGSTLAIPSVLANQSKVLVVGDSLSAGFGIDPDLGWVSLLQQANPDWLVINASISGDTTSGGVRRLPALLDQHNPTLVIIELGGNDGLRGQSLSLIQRNLQQMVQDSVQQNAQVILMEMKIPPNYGARYTERFTALYEQIASQYQLVMVPFFLESVIGQDGMMQDDGIHPTAAAQSTMMQQVQAVLEQSSFLITE